MTMHIKHRHHEVNMDVEITPLKATEMALHGNFRLLTPTEVSEYYQLPTNQGEGQTIAIIDWQTQPCPGASQSYLERFLKQNNVGDVHIEHRPCGGNDTLSAKTLLLSEIIATYLPQAQQRIYSATQMTRYMAESIYQAIADNCDVLLGDCQLPPQIMHSAYLTELDAALDIARNVQMTCCFASGNQGAGAIHYPAISPLVLAVGGTCIKQGQPLESVWQQRPYDHTSNQWYASGGGVARQAIPDYQSHIQPLSFAINGKRHYGRGIPDVAALAIGNDHWIGTGASAAMWAILVARMNTELGFRVGYLNAQLYHLKPSQRAFNDITEGGNIPPSHLYPSDGYEARAGWDACTGLGSPNGLNLLSALKMRL